MIKILLHGFFDPSPDLSPSYVQSLAVYSAYQRNKRILTLTFDLIGLTIYMYSQHLASEHILF